MTARALLHFLALILMLTACGGVAAPTERLTTTEAAIRGATEVGATRVPRAALHLKLAQEQTDKARALLQDGYNERADWTLRRAQADAELAIALAKEQETLERAEAAQAKTAQLKEASGKPQK